MAEKLDSKDTITLEELAISNSFEIAAIFNILVRKGLLSKAEFDEELKVMKMEH